MILNRVKEENFCYFNRNWRIRNQILAIQIIIILFVLIFLASSIIVGQIIIKNTIKDSSDIIFLRQTMQQLSNVWLYKEHLLYLLKSAHQQIEMVSLLNIYLSQHNPTIIQPIQCLNKPTTNDTYSYSSSFCYGLFGDSYESSEIDELKQILHVTSILTSFRIAIENTQALYYSHSNKAQFYVLSQGLYFKQGFKPHTRPWYTNHINKTRNDTNIFKVVYGNPYQIFFGGIRIPMTNNLLNQYQQMNGVVAKDIDFNQTQVFRAVDNETTINIINQNGQVVFSRLYDNPNQTFYNISNSNYTGFNDEDFTQILNYHLQNNFESNCTNLQTPKSILCRFNSLLMDYNIIQTATIEQTPYILIIFKKTKQIKQSYDQTVDLISTQFLEIMKNNLVLLSSVSFFVLIISQAISYTIFKQLKLLINYTNVNLYESFILNLHINAMKHKYFIQSSTVTNLYTRVIDLIHNLKPKRKCEQCLIEEEKQLPRSQKIGRRLKNKLRQDIVKISEQKNIFVKHLKEKQIFELLL